MSGPLLNFHHFAVQSFARAIEEAADDGDTTQRLELEYHISQYQRDPTYHQWIAHNAPIQTRHWIHAALRSSLRSWMDEIQRGENGDLMDYASDWDYTEELVTAPLLDIIARSQQFPGAEHVTEEELDQAFDDEHHHPLEMSDITRTEWFSVQRVQFDSIHSFVRHLKHDTYRRWRGD
jgi:hypothetical protein